MSERSRALPVLLWLLGGVSVIVIGAQATLALLGFRYLSDLPVLGSIAGVITSIPVFDRAATLTSQEPGAVFGLFLLILLAWSIVLIAMTSVRVRRIMDPVQWTSAVATTVAVLGYLGLYGGVYGSIVSTSVPSYQLLLLYALPVGSILTLSAGWFLYPWTKDRVDEVAETFRQAGRVAENQLDKFEEMLSGQVGLTEERLRALTTGDVPVSINVDSVEQSVREFREEAEEIRRESQREADRLSSKDRQELNEPLGSEQRSAERLLSRAQSLDPAETIETISNHLTDRGEAILDDYFDSIEESLQSRYGSRYAVSNLPDEYAIVTGSNIPGGAIALADDEAAMKRQVRSEVQSRGSDKPPINVLMESIDVLEAIKDHVDGSLRPYLVEHETEFAERSQSIESDLEVVEEQLEKIEGETGKILRSLLLEGKGESTLSVEAVHVAIEDGKDALHECRIDSADGLYAKLQEANSMVDDLQRCLLFVEGVFLQALSNEDTRVALRYGPQEYEYPFFSGELLESLEDPVEKEFGATYSVDTVEEEIRIDYVESEVTDENEIGENKQKIHRSVGDILDRLTEAASSSNGQVVKLDLETVPEYVLRQGAINELADFISKSDSVTAENLPADGGSGVIALRPNGEMNMRSALTSLKSEYEEWLENH